MGGSTTFQVRFSPNAIGARTATVSIANNDSDENPYSFVIGATAVAPEIDLQGNGVSIVNGDLTPTAADHTDLGGVTVGSAVTRTFTIRNSGNLTLTLSGTPLVALSGANAGAFTIATVPVTTVPAEGNTTFQLRFTPTAMGPVSATVTIANNDSDEQPYTFVVQGAGVAPAVPEIDVQGNGQSIINGDTTPNTADGADLGNVSVGGALTRTFTIRNIGGAALTLTGSSLVALSGTHAGAFAVSSQPPATIATVGSFQLRFTPSAPGMVTATVTIANNDSDENPYTFVVQGTGTAPAIALQGNGQTIANDDTTPTPDDQTDFGVTPVDGSSVVRTFTIHNRGNVALTLSGAPLVAVEGSNSALFRVTTLPANTITAGESSSFQLTFTPGALGLVTATVRIANNDSKANPYTFVIQGSGSAPTAPEIDLQSQGQAIVNGSTSISITNGTDFGSVAPNGGSSRTFVIQNSGNAPLTLSGSPLVTLSGVNAGTFRVVSQPVATVEAGSSSQFQITFNPDSVGIFTATVRLVNNDSDENPYTFVIGGSAATTPPGYVATIGRLGSANGRLNTPQGVAVDSSGNLYVADTRNHRIQKFSSSGGTFLAAWGGLGSGDGQFNTPTGIAVDSSGNVYVADRGNHRIQKFSSSGAYLTQWGGNGAGNGQFVNPTGVATDSNGNVYVTDSGNRRVQFFSSTGGYFTQWGSQGTGAGRFSNPTGIAVDSSGNVYVVDTGLRRVQKFSGNGVYLRTWGSLGTGAGQFTAPQGVAIDPVGNVYIADSGNHRLQKFNSNGAYLTEWGSNGNGLGQFVTPYSLAVDGVGTVYVADSGNNRIQIFGEAPIMTVNGTVNGKVVRIASGAVTPKASDGTAFGNVAVTSGASVTRTFVISNSGQGALGLNGEPAVAVSGPAASAFQVMLQPNRLVMPGSSTQFQIVFTPLSAGLVTATVNIPNGANDVNGYTFMI